MGGGVWQGREEPGFWNVDDATRGTLASEPARSERLLFLFCDPFGEVPVLEAGFLGCISVRVQAYYRPSYFSCR